MIRKTYIGGGCLKLMQVRRNASMQAMVAFGLVSKYLAVRNPNSARKAYLGSFFNSSEGLLLGSFTLYGGLDGARAISRAS